MKKISSLFLIIFLSLALFSLVSCDGTLSAKESMKYLSFELLDDGTYSVKSSNEKETPEKITIPEVYEGKPVTSTITTKALGHPRAFL